jgi:hypothetical protein
MVAPVDGLLSLRTVEFWMNIEAPFTGRLFLFHHQRMRLRVGILANSRDLPGNYRKCAGAV